MEHLIAENIDNHHEKVVDLSPMERQTGVYLSLLSDDFDNVADVIEKNLKDVTVATEVPACNEV